MSLKPWREIAHPHGDVLGGTFKQSEFAADITQVANDTAPAEYSDPEKFFARTYITEGMRLLLVSVAQRLAGVGGDPVIQLQTAFGGGKTHTMLAVFHLASRKVPTEKLLGIPPILDAAKVQALPTARVAVLDGIRLSPSHPIPHGAIIANTLWGELAWQLLGEVGYAKVAASDADGTSPGKEVLIELLSTAAPCVILIDELVAFVRQLEVGKQFNAGTFDSNISFIQALTEALKAVPNAILLASLPESEVEVGGTMGQRALNSLEKYFARVESVWKPVATEEAFEIVRRRLFEHAGEPALVESIARQFHDFYRQHPSKFPTETQSNDYFERLCHSYPIHPEVFDRLYEDWSTLDKFQRTRGVLQYMAIVIHRLWNSENRDALIMPGSLPLDDGNVRNKSIHYLPQGWEPVIEREVDGPRSAPHDIDGHHTLFGSVQAAQRCARAIFLGSAPSSSDQMIRGIKTERVLLGTVQPGQSIGVFEDVLKRLRDRLHYLYSDQDRFWLDTKPNLRREMESRKQNINERDELLPLLKTRINGVFGKNHHFAGIHPPFTPSIDVPDEFGVGPRLVVLGTAAGYSASQTDLARPAATEILKFRGDVPRQKQNRLLFLAPDFDVVGRLKEQARIFLAWRSIVLDIENGALVQDLAHLNQAKRNRDGAEQSLSQLIREAYKWLLVPSEEWVEGRDGGKFELKWDVAHLSPTAPSLVQEIETKLREEEWVIYEWSPVHLRNTLKKWYLKDGHQDVGAQKVWQDMCSYLYLPRLANDEVLRNAITVGVESDDYFGYAAAKESDQYLGFTFGRRGFATIDASSVFIERDAALAYRLNTMPAPNPEPVNGPDPVFGENPGTTPDPVPGSDSLSKATKTQFYATVKLNAVRAKLDFATIMDEVIQQFTQRGLDVSISVDIHASNPAGFDDAVQRSVKENCNVLKIGPAEFE
ncbi:ATP-binding protein [Herbaspirillum huttiense]|uniref:ATP-binding protein n=1 Tax=Herbaspirillum huttiense TaxID=863372 RepID=UPI0031D61A7B